MMNTFELVLPSNEKSSFFSMQPFCICDTLYKLHEQLKNSFLPLSRSSEGAYCPHSNTHPGVISVKDGVKLTVTVLPFAKMPENLRGFLKAGVKPPISPSVSSSFHF